MCPIISEFCRVPEEDPSGNSIVLGFGDYLRLKNASKVLTHEEKVARLEAEKIAKERALVCLFTSHQDTFLLSKSLTSCKNMTVYSRYEIISTVSVYCKYLLRAVPFKTVVGGGGG